MIDFMHRYSVKVMVDRNVRRTPKRLLDAKRRAPAARKTVDNQSVDHAALL